MGCWFSYLMGSVSAHGDPISPATQQWILSHPRLSFSSSLMFKSAPSYATSITAPFTFNSHCVTVLYITPHISMADMICAFLHLCIPLAAFLPSSSHPSHFVCTFPWGRSSQVTALIRKVFLKVLQQGLWPPSLPGTLDKVSKPLPSGFNSILGPSGFLVSLASLPVPAALICPRLWAHTLCLCSSLFQHLESPPMTLPPLPLPSFKVHLGCGPAPSWLQRFVL